ncbi:MAG: hypothetical protein WD689_01875 [Gaiellaceae bacterium]
MLERLEQLRGRALLLGPCESQPFDAFGVRVLRGGKAAAVDSELPQHVVERLLRDLAVARGPEHQPAVEVRGREQRVVVEHLLEVGHEPACVDRVAVEAAPEQVVHAAQGHPVERRRGQLPFPPPQKELERRRGRELRRAAPPSPASVEAGAQAARRLVEDRPDQRLPGRREPPGALELLGQHPRLLHDHGAALPVGIRDGGEHLLEARQSVTRLGRKVGAAEEGLALGGEEGGQRPAAVARERDDRVHVDGVDVGPLLPVDLDADEVLVHQPRCCGVLERLVLHDVAPVTGGVADREQDRLVLVARAGESLLAPRIPVDGVVGVLEQVGAGSGREPVHCPTMTEAPVRLPGLLSLPLMERAGRAAIPRPTRPGMWVGLDGTLDPPIEKCKRGNFTQYYLLYFDSPIKGKPPAR